MTIYNWLSLFGVPSILGGIVAYLIRRIQNNDAKTVAVQLGVQSLLMDKLDYLTDKYLEQGWCPSHKKRLYENMYKQYANLGQDGVMKDSYEKVMALPNSAKCHTH